MSARRWLARAAAPLAAGMALVAVLAARPAAAATVTGLVVDHDGKPVEYANVRVAALQRGAVTDAQGRFTIELPDGPALLEVVQIGYQRAQRMLAVAAGMAPLRITLGEAPVPVAEVNVEASSFGKTGKSEGAVVRRMDVYMTPGGAADIFQSLRALPGINAPAEGAALYVRGGDPRETVIRIDGAEIGHPYHYEGASGGLFSILDTYMLKSAFFSSGGFGSRYGDAMSGVLDIETQDPLNLHAVNVGANLAGGGASTSWALVPDRLSFIGSVFRSTPSLLFRLYGSSSEFEQAPVSLNGVGKLLWRYSPSGRLSAMSLQSTEEIGVFSRQLNVKQLYSSRAHNQFWAVQQQDVIAGRVAVRTNLTIQRWKSDWTFSEFEKDATERTAAAKADFVWPIGERNELAFGAEWRRRSDDLAGIAPADSTDLGSGAPVRALGTRAIVQEPSVWAEHKLRVVGPLYATVGGRLVRASATDEWLADPRGALAWRLDEHQTVRIAAGRYHQLADPNQLDPVYGNPRLGPARADHVIAGYEWKSDFGNVRIEGYRKDYRGLAVDDSATYFANRGFGFARGVDVFVQGTYKYLNGWISYGYLDTKRREADDPREVPARYGVRHSLTLVGEYAISSKWHTGARWGWATGRPYTPVVGATYDPARGVWHPVEGDHNSETLPSYQRLDVRLTRLFSMPSFGAFRASNVCVAYVEAMNVLGKHNVLDYWYSPDYTERRTIDSYFSRRLLVAGVGLSW